MGNENGEWIMYGVDEDDPYRIKSVPELISYINEIGFLPLFKNTIPGFSVEERTLARDWWSGDPECDPWEWREIIAATGEVAYGKFFDKKAGFISLKWLPYFANWRRDGYDFDARWEDGKAHHRSKKIMDLFEDATELFSFEAKQKAGFGKGGEKNFVVFEEFKIDGDKTVNVPDGENVPNGKFDIAAYEDATVTITAYAIQLPGFEGEPVDAWNALQTQLAANP